MDEDEAYRLLSLLQNLRHIQVEDADIDETLEDARFLDSVQDGLSLKIRTNTD